MCRGVLSFGAYMDLSNKYRLSKSWECTAGTEINIQKHLRAIRGTIIIYGTWNEHVEIIQACFFAHCLTCT